ncbi:MAG: hypothetical protein Q8936_09025 [Bacillota bacterium]|nr:hypothetical protein [Bacillota bacterium]
MKAGKLAVNINCSNGFRVYSEAMPIGNVTRKLCDKLNVDPLRFISSRSMLIILHKEEKSLYHY